LLQVLLTCLLAFLLAGCLSGKLACQPEGRADYLMSGK